MSRLTGVVRERDLHFFDLQAENRNLGRPARGLDPLGCLGTLGSLRSLVGRRSACAVAGTAAGITAGTGAGTALRLYRRESDREFLQLKLALSRGGCIRGLLCQRFQ